VHLKGLMQCFINQERIKPWVIHFIINSYPIMNWEIVNKKQRKTGTVEHLRIYLQQKHFQMEKEVIVQLNSAKMPIWGNLNNKDIFHPFINYLKGTIKISTWEKNQPIQSTQNIKEKWRLKLLIILNFLKIERDNLSASPRRKYL